MAREVSQFRLNAAERKQLADLADALGTTNKTNAMRFAINLACQHIDLIRDSLADQASVIQRIDLMRDTLANQRRNP
jgi:hypothetical protein